MALVILGGEARTAMASAWNRLAGEGLVIVEGASGGGKRSFDASGRLISTDSYEKSELSSYIEYGLTDSLMIVARPSLVSTNLGDPSRDHAAGFGGADMGAQMQLLVFNPAVLAVQGTFRLPGTTSQRNPADIGNTAHEADLRGLGAVSFSIGSIQAFLELQAGFRLRSGGAASQWHGDLTFGFTPVDPLVILIKSFTTIPDGPGNAWFPSARFTKVAVTAVYPLTKAWSIELGVFSTVFGRNALRERGVTAGVWYRF